MAAKYDLLMKGGEVLVTSRGIRGVRDGALARGKVAAVAEGIAIEDAGDVLDVSGKIVTAGPILIHGHYFEHIFPVSANVDEVCLPNGVTTTVDAGSSGWTHFEGFKEYVLRKSQTRPWPAQHGGWQRPR